MYCCMICLFIIPSPRNDPDNQRYDTNRMCILVGDLALSPDVALWKFQPLHGLDLLELGV